MPTTCGFPNCKFRSRYRGQEDNRHFYRIPKRPPQLRLRWLNAIGRTEETVVSQLRICSAHFSGGEKKEGDIPVPDPQFDPPLFISIPPRGEHNRYNVNDSTSHKLKKPNLKHNRLYMKTTNNNKKNNGTLNHSRRSSEQFHVLTNLQNNNDVEFKDFIEKEVNQSKKTTLIKNSDIILKPESFCRSKEFANDNKALLLNNLAQNQLKAFSSHENFVNIYPSCPFPESLLQNQERQQFNNLAPLLNLFKMQKGFSIGSGPSASSSLSTTCSYLPNTLHHNNIAEHLNQNNSIQPAMTLAPATSGTLRPLVALLDGRDCSIEMPLLKDVATVAFCDAQSTAEIHEKVLNEAVAALLYHSISLSREDLLKFKALKLVVRIGSSFHNVNVDAATEMGIAICYTPVECIEETADSTMLLILNMYRKTFWISKTIQDNIRQIGNVEHLRELVSGSTRIRGSVLGLIGFGRVGISVACRARAFGFRIIFYDPHVSNGIDRALGFERCDSFDELLSRSDCVSLHCPVGPGTRYMINNESIQKMKYGAFLVNTSAPELVMGSALLSALKSGHVKAAALDVYERDSNGSMPSTSTDIATLEMLSQMPNVICTPNCSWYSDDSFKELRISAAKEVRRAIIGRFPDDLKNCVNKEALVLRNNNLNASGNKISEITTVLNNQQSNVFPAPIKYNSSSSNAAVKFSPAQSFNALMAASTALPSNSIVGGDVIDHLNSFASQFVSNSSFSSDASSEAAVLSKANNVTSTNNCQNLLASLNPQLLINNSNANNNNSSSHENFIATTSPSLTSKNMYELTASANVPLTGSGSGRSSVSQHSSGPIDASFPVYNNMINNGLKDALLKSTHNPLSSLSKIMSTGIKSQMSTSAKRDEPTYPHSPISSPPPAKVVNTKSDGPVAISSPSNFAVSSETAMDDDIKQAEHCISEDISITIDEKDECSSLNNIIVKEMFANRTVACNSLKASDESKLTTSNISNKFINDNK